MGIRNTTFFYFRIPDSKKYKIGEKIHLDHLYISSALEKLSQLGTVNVERKITHKELEVGGVSGLVFVTHNLFLVELRRKGNIPNETRRQRETRRVKLKKRGGDRDRVRFKPEKDGMGREQGLSRRAE